MEDKQKNELGPYLAITSPSTGKQLEVTNLIKFNAAKNSDFWKAAELSIKVGVRNPTEKMPHTLFAQAQFTTSNGKEVDIPIGTISMKSMKEYDIKPGMSIQQGKAEFHFGVSDGMVDALKQQTREYIESIREEIPENQKLQLAAAIHDISHTGESKNYSSLKKTDSRKAPVIFAKIGNQVLGVLNKESINFLTQQLASKGRKLQGLTITGIVNKAPPSYADIIIDPNSVKFPDIQLENQNQSISTVAIITGVVEPKFQAKTEQVLVNMIKRAFTYAFSIAVG